LIPVTTSFEIAAKILPALFFFFFFFDDDDDDDDDGEEPKLHCHEKHPAESLARRLVEPVSQSINQSTQHQTQKASALGWRDAWSPHSARRRSI